MDSIQPPFLERLVLVGSVSGLIPVLSSGEKWCMNCTCTRCPHDPTASPTPNTHTNTDSHT